MNQNLKFFGIEEKLNTSVISVFHVDRENDEKVEIMPKLWWY